MKDCYWGARGGKNRIHGVQGHGSDRAIFSYWCWQLHLPNHKRTLNVKITNIKVILNTIKTYPAKNAGVNALS